MTRSNHTYDELISKNKEFEYKYYRKTSKIIMDEKKCCECDDKGFREYEGKLRCEKHHLEAKRIANIKFEKNEKLKKYGIIVGGIIGVVIGAIIIYQFVANL